MPVSSTRIKYTDRQAQILVRDFTSIFDSVVQNVDPGTVVPDGIEGESLLKMLLRLLQDAINSAPYVPDDATLLNFALRIINSLDTANLGVYGQVIEKIRDGSLEVMAQFSTALMKEIAKRPAGTMTNATTATYVDIIKATVEAVMGDRDFVYLLLTPEAQVSYRNTSTNTTTGTSTSSVVPLVLTYTAVTTPYTATELTTLRQTSSTTSYNQLMAKYASEATPVSISIDNDLNEPFVLRVYMSALKLLARHNAQHIITPTATASAVTQLTGYIDTAVTVSSGSYTPGYDPTNPMAFMAKYKRVMDGAARTASDNYKLCRFGVDNHYLDFRVGSAVVKSANSLVQATTSSDVRFEIISNLLIYIQAYRAAIDSNGSGTVSETVLNRNALVTSSNTLASSLLAYIPSGKSAQFICDEYVKAIKTDVTASFKALISTTDDRDKIDVRAKVVSLIVSTYLDGMINVTLNKLRPSSTVTDSTDKLIVTAYVFGLLKMLFDEQTGYFFYAQDTTTAELSSVIGVGSKFIPYPILPTKQSLGGDKEDFHPDQSTAILKFLTHLIRSGLYLRRNKLTDDWSIKMYNNMLKSRDTIVNFEDQYLHDMLKSGNMSVMTTLGINPASRRLITNALLMTASDFPLPPAGNIHNLNYVDLSKVTYHEASGKVSFTV